MRLVTLENWHPPPDVKILEDLFPKRTRWACGHGEVDVLLAVNSLHLFLKSETRRGGLDLQLSLISKNYLVMGQVARPLLRTASDSERIQTLVARHSQSWSSPTSGSRLRVRMTQPPKSKSSVQEGTAHKSARG